MQHPVQHSTLVAVCLYVLLLLYLSLSLTATELIPQQSAHYLTFPLDT